MKTMKCPDCGMGDEWDAKGGMCAKCGSKKSPMTTEDQPVRPRLATTLMFQKKK